MNKVEIEAQVAEQLGMKKSDVERVVGAFLGYRGHAETRGACATVRFATFQPVKRAARMGKNLLMAATSKFRVGPRQVQAGQEPVELDQVIPQGGLNSPRLMVGGFFVIEGARCP